MVTHYKIVLVLYTYIQYDGLTHALMGANATMENWSTMEETTIGFDRFDALRDGG